ncbi:amino acid adenylation domain-containing protein [Streptomyces sp. NPDC102365]|uniref:amino acid adenylation domain-containing protein n=1 Tax=Streptomyces sp. NPDC102365 TaxID=3366162 RepID=UPI00380E239C
MKTPLLHEAFLKHALRSPDAPALLWSGGTMTYGTLERRSAVLADRLLAAGVGRGDLVGVCVARGPALPTALLAVMRAGAAWVPLDPSYPQDRLEYMLGDSGVSLVIADGASARRLPAGVRVLDPEGADETAPAALPSVGRGDLAYVIYTSGSTGRPKGVLVEHGSVAATIAGMRAEWGVGAGERVLQFAPSSFDASVLETGVALTGGAALVLADADSVVPGPGLVDLMDRFAVTFTLLPPSVVAALPEAELPALRTLVCGGEALPAEIVARWGRGRRVFNAYGPTEISIVATTGEVSGSGTPDIGRPLPGVRIDLLDKEGLPVPDGEVGELVVSGAGVTRGYLGRPALTAERYVPTGHGRAYRTGDLARRLPDGRYAYAGRADHQVKIRGFRVEPGEIAEVLRAHPAVSDSVVVARGTVLVGYVSAPDTPVHPADLRTWCARTLPAHMVPSTVVVLPALPLTPSGKVDRQALPSPYRSGVSSGDEPATPTEQAVAALMSELLGGTPAGATDDFFQLGGHSLLVGRLAARIRGDLGTDIPLSHLFHHATPRKIAALVDGGASLDDGETVPQAPPMRHADRTRPIPLSFPQERVWFLEQLSPLNQAYRMQATLTLRGPLDMTALRAALTELVRRHEILRTAFREVDGVPAQCPVEMDAITFDVPLVDLSALSEAEREDAWQELTAKEQATPFDLDAPPLARWVVARDAPDTHRLLHVEHHLVHDGWSFAVFVKELTALYSVFAEGAAAPPEPRFQFADLAAWQRSWLDGPVMDRYLDHWAKALEGAPAALELPTDRPRPPEFTFRGDVVRLTLDPDEYHRLRERAREFGVTLYSTMLTAFAALLSRYADQTDFVLGVGVANRRLAEAERLIGMMVNTVPLRVRLDGDPTFRQLLEQVHGTAVEGYTWQDVPLQRLVKAVAPTRDLSRNPLFSAMFSFHDSAVPDLDFAGLRGEVFMGHNGTAKADLNIVAIPRAEQRVGKRPSSEDDSLTIIWEYATDLFDAETMRNMVRAYRDLLRAALDEPDLPVSRFRLTSAAPAPAAEAASAGPTVVELVERHIAEHPGRTALSAGPAAVTYGELGARADRLAEVLSRQGAGPGRPAALRLPPGTDLVAALLAAARTGVPARILTPGTEPATAEALVTETAIREAGAAVPEAGTAAQGAETVIREAGAATPEAEVAGRGDRGGRGRGHRTSDGGVLALVGRAEVTRAALTGAVAALDALGFGAGHVPQTADADSSLFLLEVWTTLARGGTLVLTGPQAPSPAALAALLAGRQEPFSALLLPDTTVNTLLAHHREALAHGTDALLAIGADTDPAALREPVGVRLATGFGTPGLPLALYRPHDGVPAPTAVVVPVGLPVPGVTAAVLDGHGEPLPAGVPGELHLARGAGARFTPTGHRARHTAAGGFEILGRTGAWPTVSGFRVAPYETRTRLTSHHGIAEAAVFSADGELHAYLVPHTGSVIPDDGELVDFLAESLPDYQIPARFTAVPTLPARATRLPAPRPATHP